MTDINDLVQEFWTSSYGAVEASFCAMRRLLEVLEGCFDLIEVCFDIMSVFATTVDSADKIYSPIGPIQTCKISACWLMAESEPNLSYCLMGIER